MCRRVRDFTGRFRRRRRRRGPGFFTVFPPRPPPAADGGAHLLIDGARARAQPETDDDSGRTAVAAAARARFIRYQLLSLSLRLNDGGFIVVARHRYYFAVQSKIIEYVHAYPFAGWCVPSVFPPLFSNHRNQGRAS